MNNNINLTRSQAIQEYKHLIKVLNTEKIIHVLVNEIAQRLTYLKTKYNL